MGCKCNGRLGNTGNPSCQMLMDIAGKLIFTYRFKADGTENYIDMSTAVINDTFVTDALNDVPSERWYPSPGELKNVSDVREDPTFQTFDDGTKFFIREGVRAVNALSPGLDTRVFKRFEEFNCVQLAAYIVDISGNLIGSRRDGETSNKLYPILISPGSFVPRYVKKTNEAAPGIMWMFDWSQVEKDGDLYMIKSSEITTNLLTINGLFDVTGTVSGISTTGFTLALETLYGDPVTGLVIGDFYDTVGGTASRIYNETDSASVTLTSVTETPAGSGSYVFVFAAQTSADELRVTPVKTKYDFYRIPEITITVP
jgi:hypothetical protein